MVELTDDIRDRFWDKVNRGPSDECWEWVGARRRNYGVLWVDGTTVNAHRISYTIHNSTEPDDYVLHECDNPPCVNPNHLSSGTPSRNIRDWYDRQNSNELFQEGQNPNSKLSREDVAEIKSSIGEQTHSEIADEYGVSYSAIAHIATGRNWADVEPQS